MTSESPPSTNTPSTAPPFLPGALASNTSAMVKSQHRYCGTTTMHFDGESSDKTDKTCQNTGNGGLSTPLTETPTLWHQVKVSNAWALDASHWQIMFGDYLHGEKWYPSVCPKPYLLSRTTFEKKYAFPDSRHLTA